MSAMEQLEHLVALPDGPERQHAMEKAMTEDSDLGRLVRRYLLNVALLQDDTTGGVV